MRVVARRRLLVGWLAQRGKLADLGCETNEVERLLGAWLRRATPPALRRELREEVNATVDATWDGQRYVGGWQQGRARDNLVNDNFSAFVVKLATDHFAVDGKEIHEARWFDYKMLLGLWRAVGSPGGKTFKCELGLARGTPEKEHADERNMISGMSAHRTLRTPHTPFPMSLFNGSRSAVMALLWLDTYESGRGLEVVEESKPQGAFTAYSAKINCIKRP